MNHCFIKFKAESGVQLSKTDHCLPQHGHIFHIFTCNNYSPFFSSQNHPLYYTPLVRWNILPLSLRSGEVVIVYCRLFHGAHNPHLFFVKYYLCTFN